jgi:hypothetical protein
MANRWRRTEVIRELVVALAPELFGQRVPHLGSCGDCLLPQAAFASLCGVSPVPASSGRRIGIASICSRRTC